VAGGAAGAWWGPQAIPERWLATLYQQDRIIRAAEGLTQLRLHHDVYQGTPLPAFTFALAADRILAGRNPLSARDIDQIRNQGVTHILDLREPSEWLPPKHGSAALEAAERLGIHRLNVPVPDLTGPSSEALDAAFAFVSGALAETEGRIFVHCRAGKERSASVLAACVARREKLTYEQALAKLRQGCPFFKPLQDQERAVRWELYARSTAARSIFFIWNSAVVARCDRGSDGWLIRSSTAFGITCHERPYLSFSQPHC
jgi:atypical dual specificity phosphatase